jgi:hypothetical protein
MPALCSKISESNNRPTNERLNPAGYSHFGKRHEKYFKNVAWFSTPQNMHLTTTLEHRITTQKSQIYHQKSPHFPSTPLKKPKESAKNLSIPLQKNLQKKSPN